MMGDTVALDRVAEMFGVHPRTILRATSGDYNVHWNEDDRDELVAQPVSLAALADVYDTTVEVLVDCVNNKDVLLRPEEAAALLSCKPRALRQRAASGTYHKIGLKGVVRYLRSEIIEDLIRRTPVD